MIHKTKNLISILIALGLVFPTLSVVAAAPTIEIKANGSSSPTTVSYNHSVELTWTSTNADYCEASGDWSGSKPISGSESMGNITSPKNYVITCGNASGYAIAEMVINITNPLDLTINKLVRNVSDGTAYLNSISADPGETLSFSIKITAGNDSLQNIIVKDTLPTKIAYLGSFKLDGVVTTGDITSGVNIGNISANQSKTIIFDVRIVEANQFSPGETTLINTALAYNNLVSHSDTAIVIVRKTGTGTPTDSSTGLTNDLFLDSFFLPLTITLLMIWLFKSHIIKFEEWLDSRRKEYREYKARKILQIRSNKAKTQEFLKKLGQN